MDSILLHTKLYRPVTGNELIARPRLQALFGGVAETLLILVSAPAGYGKSVAVSQWVESQSIPCAWLSLDSAETDLRDFLRYLIAAVRTQHPDACARTAALLEAVRLVRLSLVSGTLANDLDAIETPFLLVLDDYHRIGVESEVHTLIDRLLAYPPYALRLVIVTRTPSHR